MISFKAGINTILLNETMMKADRIFFFVIQNVLISLRRMFSLSEVIHIDLPILIY